MQAHTHVPGRTPHSLEGTTCVIVTGSIAPYTNRLYGAFAKATGANLHVLTCTALEPHRSWHMPAPSHYELKTLPGLRHHASYRSHVYMNPSVVRELARLRPDCVVVSGFSPTMMMTAAYAGATGTRLGVTTDGSVASDPGKTSLIHRMMRRMIVPRAAFGICASEDSVRLLELYGLRKGRGVVVPIVTPWEPPSRTPTFEERDFDLAFCGALNEEIKGARFFGDVVIAAHRAHPGLSVRVVGDGPLRGELAASFEAAGVKSRFDGYLQGEAIAAALASAKLMLFPSRGDAWGLVANEAVAVGTPVLASPYAVSSHELVARYGVGLVRDLDAGAWAAAIQQILGPDGGSGWRDFSRNMDRARCAFAIENSVEAMARAFSLAGLGGDLDRVPAAIPAAAQETPR